MAKKGRQKANQKLLRVCHKYLVDEDGYDIGIQDLVKSLSKEYDTYVTTFLTKAGLAEYVKKNKLTKKNGHYYHTQTGAYVLPIFYTRRHGVYVNDLFERENIKSFEEQYDALFDKVKPDIVHVHGTLTPQFLYAAKKARSQGKKTLATHHIGLINQQHHGQKTWILLRKWLIHNSFPFICDKVISLSRHGRRSFISRSKVDVSHGIGKLDAKELGSKELNKLVRQNIINLKPGAKPSEVKRFLIYPARFSRQKNQLALVEAFAEFTREEKNGLKLLLVGDAAEKAYAATVSARIEQLGMSDRIYMLKAIQHAVLLRMMKKADLLISPSLNEGLGRTCLEALQLGVPVLASNDSGHREYVDEGNNGHMFNPRRKSSIISALRKARTLRRPKQGILAERGRKHLDLMRKHYT